jgi:hypothetical protein
VFGLSKRIDPLIGDSRQTLAEARDTLRRVGKTADAAVIFSYAGVLVGLLVLMEVRKLRRG